MQRPLLRWAGSKRAQLPQIRKFWPTGFERYLEPFCGSCAALLDHQPPSALMNDINAELVNFWTMVKADPAAVHAGVAALPNSPDQYYSLRAIDPATLDRSERAVRFCYLNRYSFNGLYRTNRQGQYNVPYGGRRCGAVPPLDDFHEQSGRLAGADFICSDFEQFIRENARAGDFFYLDPPYAVKGSRVSGEYDPRAFKIYDIDRLMDCLEYIDGVGATFLLSYADDARVIERLKDHLRGRYDVRRRIAGFRGGRGASHELAFTNYEVR